MRHIPVTCEQREGMLRALGVASPAELYADVPESARLGRPLELPEAMSEIELAAHLRVLAGHNDPAAACVTFSGGGVYDHYVPSVVEHVLRRPEFFTAYTPYQPEVSQGTLQAIFEYQTMVCELTGMDVANASMYDGATALVEAALMACRVTRRSRVVCAPTVHPEWQRTLATYAVAGDREVDYSLAVDAAMGVCDPLDEAAGVQRLCEEGDVAAVLVQSPNFFGCMEDIREMGRVAHEAGALLVVAANPMLLGVLESPGALGADIVVGEGQCFGNAMSFGGPGLGIFACRQEHVRQMPGRLVGRTVDADGRTAYVLTLSTREQHIRREKATSNICSNHALNALAAGAYLAAVGTEGLAGIGRACIAKAHYLRERLVGTGRFEAAWDGPFAHEFALRYDGDVSGMLSAMFERGYLAGVEVAGFAAEWPAGMPPVSDEGLVLLAVTEKRTRSEMDAFADEVASL